MPSFVVSMGVCAMMIFSNVMRLRSGVMQVTMPQMIVNTCIVMHCLG